jgi:galactose mutarotase-like enzyme
MKKYALVQKDKIIKYKNISDTDNLIVSKLLAHGYLPVEEQAVPVYDDTTQTLSDSYEIQTDKVLRIWTIKERPFEESKQIKIENVENKTIDDIKAVFGEVDQNSQVDVLLSTKDTKVAEIEKAKTNEELRQTKKTIPEMK